MKNIFNFLFADPYEERKVDNTIVNLAEIDTVAVNDSNKPFETAIKHPYYDNNEWTVVELYDTKEEAQIGHDKWVEVFRNKLPEKLTDVSTSYIANFVDIILKNNWRQKDNIQKN